MRYARNIWCMTSSYSEFEAGFSPSTRKRKADVFKSLHTGERFWKGAFSVTVFTELVSVDGRLNRRKKFPFSNKNGYVWRSLISKQQLCTCITYFCTLLCRHGYDNDVKLLNFTFYWECEYKTTTFLSFFWTEIQTFRTEIAKKSRTFDKFSAMRRWFRRRRGCTLKLPIKTEQWTNW